MADNNLEIVLISLENCQDDSSLLKVLVTIRKEVEWPSKRDNILGLREKNSFKHIVAALQSKQKNVVDVALSILGNCCMDSACSRDIIGQYNILSNLYHILKRFSKDNSINGRVFRVVGNMCQHRDGAPNVIISRKPQIVTYIVEFLKHNAKSVSQTDQISEATVVMAVRALRQLLNKFTYKTLLKKFDVLKSIGMLLIKYSLEWQNNQKHKAILYAIIKLLLGYSSYKYYHSILDMKNTENGDAISHLSKILMLAPKEIVKIIMNFIEISQVKSDLPISEIFEGFIQVLNTNISTSQDFNSERQEYIKSLCSLLEHPANIQIGKSCKTIPLLIEILNNLKTPNSNTIECCTLIIATLINCQYDNVLILVQLKCNIIDILIEKFKWIVGCTETLNTDHKDEKKRKDDGLNRKANCKRQEVRFCELSLPNDELDCVFTKYMLHNNIQWDSSPSSDLNSLRYSGDRSPSSSNDLDSSYTSSSPVPSPTLSSSPTSFFWESDSDDDYSPVCSDVDPLDYAISPSRFNEDDLNEADNNEGNDSDDKESYSLERFGDFKLKIALFVEIMKLLKVYAKLQPSVPDLIKPPLLVALIKCSGHFDCSISSQYFDTIEFISMLLIKHDYLLPLMQTNFIPMMYNLTEMQHGIWCTKCTCIQQIGQTMLRAITSSAESDGGKGDIAHNLMRGDDTMKKQLVSIIPYIVRNKTILSKLMLNCGGLKLLMTLCKIETTVTYKYIEAVCLMARKKLSILNPKKKSLQLQYKSKIFPVLNHHTNSTHIVTFKLDDGSMLNANRTLLSKKSDFFDKLLTGDFKESNEDEVNLKNVVNKSLQWLLYFLQCNTNNNNNNNNKTDESELDLDTLLDVIALCDRFLLDDLTTSLVNYVEQHRITWKTVPTIYRWSLKSATDFLRVESVAFALVANITNTERHKMFQNLFLVGYWDKLVDDIEKLLVRFLSLRAE